MKTTALLSILAIPFLALSVSCSDTAGGNDNSDCIAGQVAIDGSCHTLCSTDNNCDEGNICIPAGYCEVGSRDEAPVLTGINGTGSEYIAEGHATRRIQDRLVLDGVYLVGATVSLLGASSGQIDFSNLPILGTPTNSRINVELPLNLTAGNYTLSVTNSVG
ncbi:hypothetical protein KAI87_07250, partial [Myxococcota bacterium]|nr:hypothetical protein [Myxococcota bacterium]